MEWSGVGSGGVGWCRVGSSRVQSRGFELSGAEWSRFKSSQGVELIGVESTIDSRF